MKNTLTFLFSASFAVGFGGYACTGLREFLYPFLFFSFVLVILWMFTGDKSA
jgi:hypothetical protein